MNVGASILASSAILMLQLLVLLICGGLFITGGSTISALVADSLVLAVGCTIGHFCARVVFRTRPLRPGRVDLVVLPSICAVIIAVFIIGGSADFFQAAWGTVFAEGYVGLPALLSSAISISGLVAFVVYGFDLGLHRAMASE